MKVIVILDVDEDGVLDAHTGGDLEKLQEASLEFAIESELGWASESGISVNTVICPDNLPGNDAQLGADIRELTQE